MPALATRGRLATGPTDAFGPATLHQLFMGIEVPDPITFCIGTRWLNRPNLYPRQATLLKIIFLRDDLFTQFDLDVIEEWEAEYERTGDSGIVPNIRWRITWLKAKGYKWFREVLLVMGRRGGKGHVTALAMAYVLWHYMAKGDPQGFYGVDRDKKLSALVFAGKRDQAKATVFADLANVIIGSNCFASFINKPHAESLTIYAPHDFVRMKRLRERGVFTDRDMATFEILPKESTTMAGRGPTSFMQAFDEQAHVVVTQAQRDGATEVYQAAKPSLDQFGRDAFVVAPSSPWQRIGQFYENYARAILEDDTGHPVNPDFLMIQLASWAIYEDWERAQQIAIFPAAFTGDLGEYTELEYQLTFQPLRGAIQVFDEQLEREEAANPETFAVERRAKFATALDAYLNEKKVLEIFAPWEDRLPQFGPPALKMESQGMLIISYKGHADPSKVNDKFGIAVAHAEPDKEGRLHCVFDLIHHFDPADFPDHIIDYEVVDDWLWDHVINPFKPDEFTFDQYNSTSSIQKLQKKVRAARLPKQVQIFERTTTRPYDWTAKENSKAAINLGLVHAPYYERAELELRFLQLINGRVDHPSAGPVQSKDIADAMMECIHVLIGEQVNNFVHGDLKNLRPGMSAEGGFTPFPETLADEMSRAKLQEAFQGFARARGGGQRPGGTMGSRTRGYRP